MPTSLPYQLLPVPVADRIAIAVEADQVTPLTVPLRGNVILIAGRRHSGRSSMLAGIAAQARRSSTPPARVIHLDPDQPVPEGLEQLWLPPASGWTMLLIDDAHRWESERADVVAVIAKLAREAARLALAVVVAVDSDHARVFPGELVSLAVQARKGVLLQPEAVDDGLLGAELPFGTVEPVADPGRGLWCWNGSVTVVQTVRSGTDS